MLGFDLGIPAPFMNALKVKFKVQTVEVKSDEERDLALGALKDYAFKPGAEAATITAQIEGRPVMLYAVMLPKQG